MTDRRRSIVDLAHTIHGVCADLAAEGRTEGESMLVAFMIDTYPDECDGWAEHVIETMIAAEASRLGVLS